MDDPALALAVLALQSAIEALVQPIRVKLERDQESPGVAAIQAEIAQETERFKILDALPDRNREQDEARTWQIGIISALKFRLEMMTSSGDVLPCLIDQLVDSVGSSSSRGQKTTSGVSAPINLAAAALVGEIEHTTRWGNTAWVGRTFPTLRQQVQAWGSRAGVWRVTAPSYLRRAVVTTQEWVVEIRALLDPEKRWRAVRDTYCPNCEAWHVMTTVDGEKHRVPALLVDTETGSVGCQACGTVWEPNVAAHLAKVLAQQRAETHARRGTLGSGESGVLG